MGPRCRQKWSPGYGNQPPPQLPPPALPLPPPPYPPPSAPAAALEPEEDDGEADEAEEAAPQAGGQKRIRDASNRRRGGRKYQADKRNKEREQRIDTALEIMGSLARTLEQKEAKN